MSEPPKKDQEEPTVVGGVPVFVVQRQAKPVILRQLKGVGAPRDVPLELEELVIGRALDVHVCVDSASVSRRHASLKRSDAGYTIADLGSGNGVYVNSERVESALLRPGDTLQIGEALFVFQERK